MVNTSLFEDQYVVYRMLMLVEKLAEYSY